MARAFTYQDPAAAIGQSIGTALFGNPEAARALAETRAKMDYYGSQSEEARAHAGLYGSQADDMRVRTSNREQLPSLGQALLQMAGISPAPVAPAAPAAPVDALAPLPEPAPAAAFDKQGFQQGIAPVIMALAGTQENPNIGDTIGALGAMLGDDETARRAMIAQGHTPGKEFALTPQRADDIAKQGYDADYKKGVDVARINHSNDIPVANIRAGASRDVATINAGSKFEVAAMKGAPDIAGVKSVGSQFGSVTSTLRTPKHNKEVGGAHNSFHLTGNAIDIARRPGVSHAQVEQAYRDAGYTVLESLDEGDHSHFALAGGPSAKGAKGGKEHVRAVSATTVDGIEELIDDQLAQRGFRDFRASSKQGMLAYATRRYQESGNAAQAVRDTFRKLDEQMKSAPAGVPTANSEAAQLRREAAIAIGKGAPRDLVAQRFKRLTGQDL